MISFDIGYHQQELSKLTSFTGLLNRPYASLISAWKESRANKALAANQAATEDVVARIETIQKKRDIFRQIAAMVGPAEAFRKERIQAITLSQKTITDLSHASNLSPNQEARLDRERTRLDKLKNYDAFLSNYKKFFTEDAFQ